MEKKTEKVNTRLAQRAKIIEEAKTDVFEVISHRRGYRVFGICEEDC
jgi:hypothetical protein